MSEKGANIDLLFRNGLKDYEVLPPAGVWEGVKSSGKLKSRPFILLRVAAAATILLTVSFFTYQWSRDIGRTEDTAIAFKAGNPSVPGAVADNYLPPEQANISNIIPSVEVNPEDMSPYVQVVTSESIDSPGPVFRYGQNFNISLSESPNTGGLFTKPEYAAEQSKISTKLPEFQYLPDEIAPKKENRWSIAAMASPTYYSKFSSGSDELSKQLMEAEDPVISYTGGLGLSYKISKRFSIQSGLYYSTMGQTLDGINTFGGFRQYDNSKGDNNFEILTSSGTISASNPDVFVNADASNRVITKYTNDIFDPKKASLQYINSSLTQSLSYLELPVILRYKIIDKTIGINVIGGMSYNLLVNNSVYTEVDGSKYVIGDTRGLNPLSLSSSLGMGMEYNFSKKLSLNLEPTFRYYLNPFSVSSGTYLHPYSFGIFSGVSYKF
jgi:hypothetical protein